MKIILDAMGGDFAPEAPVMGAIDAVKAYGAQIVLVGRGEEILSVMRAQGYHDLPDGIEIAHADEVVDMHDDPATVVRKRKNSSMMIGLKMLKALGSFLLPLPFGFKGYWLFALASWF